MNAAYYARPTLYAPPVQDADGNPLPVVRNYIPRAMRAALAQLGAVVTHGTHLGSEVEIPGSNRKAAFAPGGRLWTKPADRDDAQWSLATHTRNWEPDAVIHHIADGSREHYGTHHYLSVYHIYNTDGVNHWMQPSAFLMTYPNGRPHSRTWPPYFRDFHRHAPENNPPETAEFARDVMLGHAPVEALADWLADAHGVGHLIRPHGGDSSSPGPDDYYAPPPEGQSTRRA